MGLKKSVRRLVGKPGTANLRKHTGVAAAAAEHERAYAEASDTELKTAFDGFRGDLDGRERLAKFCALVREAANRAIGERSFAVQLQGALGILDGTVVEMKTGEGKTLSGAIAALGMVARGRQVQIMTVNDYLAHRDATWMAPIYRLLGVESGWVTATVDHDHRRDAYAANICYGAVTEIGFDLLRDRLRTDPDQIVQPEPDAAIIDEADSVMIDEAKVPLVLAGSMPGAEDGTTAADIVRRLTAGQDYESSHDGLQVNLTEDGLQHCERLLGINDLYAEGNEHLLSQINVALYAEVLTERDVDYIVSEGKIRLIDPNRGRVAQRQRWPDGLHAAVEAKEGVATTERGQILDSITVQALVKRYQLVGGMTGTAVSAAEQFREFYQLETGDIATNRPCIRSDDPDRIYPTAVERDNALITAVDEAHQAGRPVLIGTHSVAESERIAERLEDHQISAAVLNAKNDEREAELIAAAGVEGAVTVSTQMAGRGVDIKLGGGKDSEHDQVADLGGLLVIGYGRYHTRRLDDQLRGRAGRQGDPGSSVIFVSLDDDPATSAIELRDGDIDSDGMINTAHPHTEVDRAQRVSEGALLDTHRNSWNYSQQLEAQRNDVLGYRDRVLRGSVAADEFSHRCTERWRQLAEDDDIDEATLDAAAREILLRQIDHDWSEHLAFTTDLREGIHLRALGRETPLMAFHSAASDAFATLRDGLLDRATEAFEQAVITENGLDADASGLQRPSATWTYMVDDNPFGSGADRFLGAVGGVIKRAVHGTS